MCPMVKMMTSDGVHILYCVYHMKSLICYVPSTEKVRFNVPPNTLQVISGTGFYGSNDPTNSVKALKEDRYKGLGFNPIRSTSPRSQ